MLSMFHINPLKYHTYIEIFFPNENKFGTLANRTRCSGSPRIRLLPLRHVSANEDGYSPTRFTINMYNFLNPYSVGYRISTYKTVRTVLTVLLESHIQRLEGQLFHHNRRNSMVYVMTIRGLISMTIFD